MNRKLIAIVLAATVSIIVLMPSRLEAGKKKKGDAAQSTEAPKAEKKLKAKKATEQKKDKAKKSGDAAGKIDPGKKD